MSQITINLSFEQKDLDLLPKQELSWAVTDFVIEYIERLQDEKLTKQVSESSKIQSLTQKLKNIYATDHQPVLW
jgi:hypothetical protein